MPQIFRMGEYWIYFWTNESKPLEPIHVHIAKGSPTANSTKYGLPAPENVFCVITILVFPHIL